jgi:hypothetical protein
MKKLLLALLILTTFKISACRERTKTYDWIPTECAPNNYPVQIFKGYLYYGDNKNVSIPDGRVVNYGWGENGSVNLVGDKMKEAPTAIEIAWISFAEKKNYTGRFELDTKKIDSLLSEGYLDDTESNGKGNFHYIKVGLAPGGNVVLWLTGVRNKQVEIGSYTAKTVENLDWRKVYPNMEGSFDVYVNNVIKDLPDETKEEINEGKVPYAYWSGLRQRYQWRPVVEISEIVSRLEVDYINKERNFWFGEASRKIGFGLLAAPEELSVYWKDNRNQEIRTEIKFSEDETVALFSKMKTGEKAELIVTLDPEKKDAKVTLKTLNTTVTFKNVKVQSFYL